MNMFIHEMPAFPLLFIVWCLSEREAWVELNNLIFNIGWKEHRCHTRDDGEKRKIEGGEEAEEEEEEEE